MAPICIVLASLAATINDLVIINRRRANSDFLFRKSLHRRILARHLARSLPEFAKMDTTKSKWPRLRCSCFSGSYYRCINNDQKMKVYFGLCVPEEAARSDLGRHPSHLWLWHHQNRRNNMNIALIWIALGLIAAIMDMLATTKRSRANTNRGFYKRSCRWKLAWHLTYRENTWKMKQESRFEATTKSKCNVCVSLVDISPAGENSTSDTHTLHSLFFTSSVEYPKK